MERKEQVKVLGAAVMPLIQGMMKELEGFGGEEGASLSMNAKDGYFNLNLYGTGWEIVRYGKGRKPSIRYQYNEELEVPDAKRLDNTSENIIEIAWTFETMVHSDSRLSEIDSKDWKQKFVEWAAEFEEGYEDNGSYQDDISDFAVEKIHEYYREVRESE